MNNLGHKIIRKVFTQVKAEGCCPIDFYTTGRPFDLFTCQVMPLVAIKKKAVLRHFIIAFDFDIICGLIIHHVELGLLI